MNHMTSHPHPLNAVSSERRIGSNSSETVQVHHSAHANESRPNQIELMPAMSVGMTSFIVGHACLQCKRISFAEL